MAGGATGCGYKNEAEALLLHGRWRRPAGAVTLLYSILEDYIALFVNAVERKPPIKEPAKTDSNKHWTQEPAQAQLSNK